MQSALVNMINNKIILDIVCGKNKIEGAIGLYIRETKNVDVIEDAISIYLPFKDEVYDKVYSSHVIEHFSHHLVRGIMKNWVRVLKKGGTIEIRCPWLRIRALLFFLNPTWGNIINIYGGQDHEGNFHKCGFSFGLLKNLLEECDIHKVRRVIKGYRGIPFIPDCLHVIGIKKDT